MAGHLFKWGSGLFRSCSVEMILQGSTEESVGLLFMLSFVLFKSQLAFLWRHLLTVGFHKQAHKTFLLGID